MGIDDRKSVQNAGAVVPARPAERRLKTRTSNTAKALRRLETERRIRDELRTSDHGRFDGVTVRLPKGEILPLIVVLVCVDVDQIEQVSLVTHCEPSGPMVVDWALICLLQRRRSVGFPIA